MKTCIKCGEEKTLDQFYNNDWEGNTRFPYGRPDCKDCYNKSQTMKKRIKRGFASLKTAHCECCGEVCDTQVDHDHNIDSFRGFVCGSCNTKLGKIEVTHGSMFDVVKNKPGNVDNMYLKYYKQAIFRAGYTWYQGAKYKTIWGE